jgi:hypothetical protein
MWRPTGLNRGGQRVTAGQKTTVVVSGAGTPAPQQSDAAAPVDTKGKGAAIQSDVKRPEIEQGLLDIIWGLERFAVMDIPHDPQAWPKIVWERLFPKTPPPEYGDYFAVPIREEWEPMVSPEIVERVNHLLSPFTRVEVRRSSPGTPTLVAIGFSGLGNPNVVPHVQRLARNWSSIQLWHDALRQGDMVQLDVCIYKTDLMDDSRVLHLREQAMGKRE